MPQAPVPPTLLLPGAIADARADIPGGAVLLEWGGDAAPLGGRILAAGPADEVRAHPAAPGARVVELPGRVLLPGFVNAHAHLDLTHVGPRPYEPEGGFVGWVRMILRERRRDDAGVAESVHQGVGLLLEGGVVAVGDIAGMGSLAPLVALRESPMLGVSFIERFGLAERAEESAAASRRLVEADRAGAPSRVALGLQPHAPYSASLRVYEEAAALQRVWGTPVATHLSECPEEIEFVESATGPMRDFLTEIGEWRDTLFSEFGRGRRPIAHLARVLERARILCAHLHSVTDDELATLAQSGTPVVYCPRCADYFGRPGRFGPHRYRDMLSAGIRVALGTDSVVNLPPTGDGRAPALSTLDEARYLVQRDGLPARTALAMATTHGAEALDLDPAMCTFEPGPIAGIVAIECGGGADRPIEAVMRSDAPPRLLRPGMEAH